jgi:hypothetical protein
MEANFVRGCSLRILEDRCLGWNCSEVLLVEIELAMKRDDKVVELMHLLS